MSDEFCPECGAKITGNTGFCSECGAVTTSLQNSIDEAEKAKIEAEKIREEQRKQKNEELKQNIIKNKKWIIIGLIIIIAIPLIIMSLPEDTSNKIYDGGAYTVEYPYNYNIREDNEITNDNTLISTFVGRDDGGFFYIESCDSKLSAKETADQISHFELNNGEMRHLTDGGTTEVDGCKAYIVIDEIQDWTSVLFKKDGKIYNIRFKDESQEQEFMDSILNSFKFKYVCFKQSYTYFIKLFIT